MIRYRKARLERIVVSSFNPDYPMIRLGTGDLSAMMPGVSPCGRTNVRLRGWMGRADQTAKVKGMFVHPKQIAELASRHSELKRRAPCRRTGGGARHDDLARRNRRVCRAALESAIAANLQSITKLKGAVKLVDAGIAAE